MNVSRQRGVVLTVALLLLLMMSGMSVGFLYDTQNQANYNAALKLNGFYRLAAENAVRQYLIGVDEWVASSGTNLNELENWRLGGLLKGAKDPTYPEYGVLVESTIPSDLLPARNNPPTLNGGLLPLDYRIYAINNRDDLAYVFNTYETSFAGKVVSADDWDTDGKIVLTVQVYNEINDGIFTADRDFPVLTLSILAQPTGTSSEIYGREAVIETSETTNTGATEDTGLDGQELIDALGEMN